MAVHREDPLRPDHPGRLRATREIVRVLGIDVAQVWLLVFGIGTGIAGLSGVLAAPTQGSQPGDGHPGAGRSPSSSPSSAAWARCPARSSPACWWASS